MRAGIQSLIQAAMRKDFDVLVCEALDRLSRNLSDIASLYQQLEFAGVRIVTLAVQADGRVLLGGYFTAINGIAHNRLARLSTAEAALQTLTLNGLTSVNWLRSSSAPELALPPTLAFSLTGNPGTFAPLGTMNRIAGGWQLATLLPLAQNFSVQAEGVTTSGYGNGSSGRVQSTARLFLTPPDHVFSNGFE